MCSPPIKCRRRHLQSRCPTTCPTLAKAAPASLRAATRIGRRTIAKTQTRAKTVTSEPLTVSDMPDSQGANGDTRHETALERLDRNLEELTGELRVVVTGVQVLFAFLLIVPFNVGFAHVGDFERTVYFVTLLLTALATVCTIAPSAQHRFLFRHDDKQQIVFTSNRVVIAGLGFLALAMCGCLLLVTNKLFGLTAGVLTAVFGALPFAALWFVVPIRRLRQLERGGGQQARGRG